MSFKCSSKCIVQLVVHCLIFEWESWWEFRARECERRNVNLMMSRVEEKNPIKLKLERHRMKLIFMSISNLTVYSFEFVAFYMHFHILFVEFVFWWWDHRMFQFNCTFYGKTKFNINKKCKQNIYYSIVLSLREATFVKCIFYFQSSFYKRKFVLFALNSSYNSSDIHNIEIYVRYVMVRKTSQIGVQQIHKIY